MTFFVYYRIIYNIYFSKMLPAQDNLPIVKIPKLKRLFDIIFSLLMIIITFPLFVVIVLAVVIEHILRGKFFVLIFYF